MRETSKTDRRNEARDKEVEKDRYTKLEQDKRKKCSKTDRRKGARKSFEHLDRKKNKRT